MSTTRRFVTLLAAATLVAVLLPVSAWAACPAYLTPVANHDYVCSYSGTTHPLMQNGWSNFTRWDYRYQNSSNLKRGIETFQFPGQPVQNLKADWASPVQLSPNVCRWEYTLPLDGIQCTRVDVTSYGVIFFRGCNDGHVRDCFF